MRIMLASATALALSLGATSALAQAQPQELSQPTTQPATTTATSASSSDAGNQVICRPAYHNGSLIPERTCHTQREWETIRYQNQRTVNETQMRGLTSQSMGH